MTNTIETGSDIYINTGVATAHCAVGVTGVCAKVFGETEKAIHIEAASYNGKTHTCWIPKKALVSVWSDDNGYIHANIAKWFRPSGWTKVFFEICSTSSTVSA